MGAIKTFNGLARTVAKTINGLAIASVKTRNSIDATDAGIRIAADPFGLLGPTQGSNGWWAGRFTTKGDPTTFSTSGFYWTTSGYPRFVSDFAGFSTPYVADVFSAPGYGNTTYDTVRRYIASADGTTRVDGRILAGAESGRTVVMRVFHNTTEIYSYTVPSGTAVDITYSIDDFTVASGDSISWEMDKTAGGYVAADITFSGILS